MKKRTLDLGGSWECKEYPEAARRMRDLEEGQWMSVSVPSSIYTGLIEAGCFTRFDLEANPEDFSWIAQREWVYRKRIDLANDVCDCDEVDLVFEGLDTVTHIWFNEKLIGKTENMFMPHRFSISDRVRPGQNTLMVKFLSATAYAERLLQRYGPMSDHHYGDPRRSYIRKAQYQFGSVLAPALPGCGIYRPVRLEAWNTARIEDVHIRTIDCNEHYADVRVAVAVRRAATRQAGPLTGRITLSGAGQKLQQTLHFEVEENRNTAVIRIERPVFWQPVGYGVPHCYHLEISLCDRDGSPLDTHTADFGVRTIRLGRGKDAPDGGFRFEVNDRSVYIKGASWIPLSMFPGSHTPADYERRLTQLKEAHVNMLRVWGGGYYEDDIFYRLCDKLGILVWQDFAFASAYYPDRRWFLSNIQAETQAVVRRLRNYACLALWCGNSRIDHLHETGRLGQGRKFYGRAIYHELLPKLLGELDPDRDYIPTTPDSDAEAKEPNAPTDGTYHDWRVWNDFAPTSDYLFDTPELPRFLAEFGLQSLPGRECLERICPPHRFYCSSEAIEKHNYQDGGHARLARYSADLFRPPHTLDAQIEQTQLAQARAIKLCAEHLRANNHINGGLLFWTANDCAAAAGFSAIDYAGCPKALYYYARRFFAPVLVTLETDKNAYLAGHLQGNGVVVVNDTALPLTGKVRCRCMDFYGRCLDRIDYPIAIGPFSRSLPRVLPRALALPAAPNRCVLQLEVETASGVIAENRFFYLPDKFIDWPTAHLDVQVRPIDPFRLRMCITSKTLLRDVSITPPERAVLSDNFLDILPNRPTQIDFHFAGNAPSTRTPFLLRSIPCGLEPRNQ